VISLLKVTKTSTVVCMRHRFKSHSRQFHHLPKLTAKSQLVTGYFITIVFFYLADGLIAYAMPIVIEQNSINMMVVGIILSLSSAAGFLTDIIFPELFPTRGVRFYTRLALGFALVTALTLFGLPHILWVLALGSVLWGAYYEAISFSHFTFVHQLIPAKKHDSAWGWLETIRSIGYVIAPILGAFLLLQNNKHPFGVALFFFLLASGIFLGSRKAAKQMKPDLVATEHQTFSQELGIWRKILRKIWHIYFFYFALIMVDMAFWSVGILLSVEMLETSKLSSLVLPAYMVPFLIVPLFASKLNLRWKKSQVAFVTAAAGALLLAIGSIFSTGVLLILAIFVASVFLALATPEILAVFQDYTETLGVYGNDMVGLQRSASSFAWIIGPLVAGALSTLMGNQLTMSFFAFVLFVSAIIAHFGPKKIGLSQKGLQKSGV